LTQCETQIKNPLRFELKIFNTLIYWI